MIYRSQDMEQNAVLQAAALMCAAARTAPKTKGLDNIVTCIVTGDELVALAEKMKEVGLREFGTTETSFTRDANNLLCSDAVVLIGVKRARYGLTYCSHCGFDSCKACEDAGAMCVFAPIDLGIALGSAVSAAADLRIDNRIMYSIGKVAEEMGYAGDPAARIRKEHLFRQETVRTKKINRKDIDQFYGRCLFCKCFFTQQPYCI